MFGWRRFFTSALASCSKRNDTDCILLVSYFPPRPLSTVPSSPLAIHLSYSSLNTVSFHGTSLLPILFSLTTSFLFPIFPPPLPILFSLTLLSTPFPFHATSISAAEPRLSPSSFQLLPPPLPTESVFFSSPLPYSLQPVSPPLPASR